MIACKLNPLARPKKFIFAATLVAIQLLLPAYIQCQSHHDDSDTDTERNPHWHSPHNETISPIDQFGSEDSQQCMPMSIKFCESVDYNFTMLPNMFGHTSQIEIETEMNIYHPIVSSGCSSDLRLFLCTVYAPICFEPDQNPESKPLNLLPCQSLCESARQGCANKLRELRQDWPPALQCDKFPILGRNKSVLCVGNDTIDSYEPPARDIGFVCPKNFEIQSYTLHLNGKVYNNCAMPCDDVYLDKYAAKIVSLATGVVASICILATSFTCISFLIKTDHFEYPSRPIIIIAFCQLMVASCYLIGFITHNDIACNEPAKPPKDLPNMIMIRTMTMGNKKGSCTLLFMLMYYFLTSSIFWILMLNISWYMIARLKWAPEYVSGLARYFHLVSWTVPALMTIYLSVLGEIEGEPLTGICHVRY